MLQKSFIRLDLVGHNVTVLFFNSGTDLIKPIKDIFKLIIGDSDTNWLGGHLSGIYMGDICQTTGQTRSVLTLATLDDEMQIGTFLLVSHQPRWPNYVKR